MKKIMYGFLALVMLGGIFTGIFLFRLNSTNSMRLGGISEPLNVHPLLTDVQMEIFGLEIIYMTVNDIDLVRYSVDVHVINNTAYRLLTGVHFALEFFDGRYWRVVKPIEPSEGYGQARMRLEIPIEPYAPFDPNLNPYLNPVRRGRTLLEDTLFRFLPLSYGHFRLRKGFVIDSAEPHPPHEITVEFHITPEGVEFEKLFY